MKQSRLISRFRKPIALRRVVGHSMEPNLRAGQFVVFSSLFTVSNKSVVLSTKDEKDVVKRLHLDGGQYSLRGDNRNDTQDFENIDPESVTAKLIYPQL